MASGGISSAEDGRERDAGTERGSQSTGALGRLGRHAPRARGRDQLHTRRAPRLRCPPGVRAAAAQAAARYGTLSAAPLNGAALALMGNEAAKLAAPEDAERFGAALSRVGEVNADPARCAVCHCVEACVRSCADAPAPWRPPVRAARLRWMALARAPARARRFGARASSGCMATPLRAKSCWLRCGAVGALWSTRCA